MLVTSHVAQCSGMGVLRMGVHPLSGGSQCETRNESTFHLSVSLPQRSVQRNREKQ